MPEKLFADRVHAEAVRAFERLDPSSRVTPEADAAGRASGADDLEGRIIARARAVDAAPALANSVQTVVSGTGWLILVVLAVALAMGAGAVRAALGAPEREPVNVFLLLAGLLGVQTLLLLAWIVLLIVRPRSARVSPLGNWLFGATRWAATRMAGHSATHLAAVQALAAAHLRGARARWGASAISHAMWSAANLGAIAVLLVLLSTRQYTFTWETTILSDEAYARMTSALGQLPQRLGFVVPTPEQIEATRAAAPDAVEPSDELVAAAPAWSGFLTGCLVTYGLAPRVVLAMLMTWLARRACRRWRLDTSAPGYAELQARLAPGARREGVVDAPEAGEAEVPAVSLDEVPEGTGPPVILGLEMTAPGAPWPPPVHGVRFDDLGFVTSRSERNRVEAALEGLEPRPGTVVIVASLTTTPDRGLGASIGEIAGAARAPVALVLTGGERLRLRSNAEDVAQRVRDWHALGVRAGIDPQRIIDVDLEHLTESSRGALAALVGVAHGHGGERRLESAFGLIGSTAKAWPAAPSPEDGMALHRAIGELYGAPARSWRDRLRVPALRVDGGVPSIDLASDLRAGAQSVVDLMPERLRRAPKWMLAGAVAGGLGCAATAMLVAPAALGALPIWSGLGSALGAAVLTIMPGSTSEATEGDAALTRGDHVRAAGLFALLLELQGRDEATITRVLDEAVTDDLDRAADPGADDGGAAWLDELRHRVDLALASTGGRA